LSYADIARVLDISTNAAQQLVFHAIRALRQHVNAAGDANAGANTSSGPD
jgi:DNA-directed RNA polymerase specialized sigma24 family protein